MSDMIRATQQVVTKFQHYGLWRLVAWGEGMLALIDGATFFAKGNPVANGSSYSILKNIPGGMHTHGALMLVIAAYVFYSSAHKNDLSFWVQFGVMIYSTWVTVAVTTGWIIANQISIGITTKWLFIMWVAFGLMITSRSELRPLTPKE